MWKSYMFKEHCILFPNYVGLCLCGHARCFRVAFISVQLFVWLIGPLHAWFRTRQSHGGNILFLLIWCLNSAAYLVLQFRESTIDRTNKPLFRLSIILDFSNWEENEYKVKPVHSLCCHLLVWVRKLKKKNLKNHNFY